MSNSLPSLIKHTLLVADIPADRVPEARGMLERDAQRNAAAQQLLAVAREAIQYKRDHPAESVLLRVRGTEVDVVKSYRAASSNPDRILAGNTTEPDAALILAGNTLAFHLLDKEAEQERLNNAERTRGR